MKVWSSTPWSYVVGNRRTVVVFYSRAKRTICLMEWMTEEGLTFVQGQQQNVTQSIQLITSTTLLVIVAS